MKNRKIWLAMCICGLFLVGCGNKQDSQQPDGTAPETTRLETQQPMETQRDELPEAGEDKDQKEGSSATGTGSEQAEGSSVTDAGSGQAEANQPSPSADQVKMGSISSSSKNKTKTSSRSSSGKKTTKTTKITKKQAFAKALKHAGVKENQVTVKRIKKEYEDGTQVYDIEFYANGKEYDYEIRIADGKILKFDHEIEDDFNGQGTGKSDGEITKSEAKKIALAKVPGAKKIYIKKDRENGRIVYEGEIHYGNKEYEFEIDASTGKILSWEVDNDYTR